MEGLRHELPRHTYIMREVVTRDLTGKKTFFSLIQHCFNITSNHRAIHITRICLCMVASTIFDNNLRNHTEGLVRRQALCAALPNSKSSPPNERGDYDLGSIVPRLGGVSVPPARRQLPTRATIVLRLSYRHISCG